MHWKKLKRKLLRLELELRLKEPNKELGPSKQRRLLVHLAASFLNSQRKVTDLIIKDVKLGQEVATGVSIGTVMNSIKETKSTKKCMRKENMVSETIITAELLEGVPVDCGATLIIHSGHGINVIQ